MIECPTEPPTETPTATRTDPLAAGAPSRDLTRPPGLSTTLAALLAAITLAAPLAADVIVLKNGNRFEGEVSPGSSEGRMRVTIDSGVYFEFLADEIDTIEYGPSPSQQFDERLEKIAADDLDALLGLAAWARERKLRSREEVVYRRILRIDPNNEPARSGLGYVIHRNRWVRESELKTSGLVLHDGQWVEPEERARRARERLRKEVADDLRGVVSDNEYVQEYSIRKILNRKDPWMRHVLVEYLIHESQAVRIVAAQTIASLTENAERERTRSSRRRGTRRRAASETGTPTPEEERALDTRISDLFFRRTFEEEDTVARKAIANALMRMRLRRYFELALAEVRTSPNALHRERSAEGALFALRKEWVPEFIDALGATPPGVPLPGNPAVRRVLRRVFNQDFEYRVDAWQAWWRDNAHRFTDEA